jgi:hypothetical protein
MTLKKYFLATKVTTKRIFRVCTIIFAICFVVFYFAMKIGGKLGEEESLSYLYNNGHYIIFVYGLTLMLIGIVLFASYATAKRDVKIYSSIPQRIKDRFDLHLYPEYLYDRNNYLRYNIYGIYEGLLISVKYIGEVKLILCVHKDSEIHFQELMANFHSRYKHKKLQLNGFGMARSFKQKEWQQISLEKMEDVLRDMLMIAKKEGFDID